VTRFTRWRGVRLHASEAVLPAGKAPAAPEEPILPAIEEALPLEGAFLPTSEELASSLDGFSFG
jgi:hypothetical protein